MAVVDEADGQPVIKLEQCDTGPDENLAFRLALLAARTDPVALAAWAMDRAEAPLLRPWDS